MTDTGGGTGDTTAPLVHRLAGEQALARGHRLLDPLALEDAASRGGVDHDRFIAAVLALAGGRVVNVHTIAGSLITLLRLTEEGMRAHLATTRSDLDAVRRRLINTLRAEGPHGTAVDLAATLGEPRLVVEVLLDGLRDEGRVVFTNVPGGMFRIHRFG